MALVQKKPAREAQESMPVNFGKRLAHTDKLVRDRGFSTLKTWLKGHPELDRLEYMKLWKGLFFGMWMADKRHVQQELAVNIAVLMGDVPRSKWTLWVDSFSQTMADAWEKLDKHRIDKYVMLVRIVMAESFKSLRVGGWALSEAAALSAAFSRGAPSSAMVGPSVSNVGLVLHMARLLWDELQPQLTLEPAAPPEALLEILEPFCSIAENSHLEGLVRVIHENVLSKAPSAIASKLIPRLLAGAAKPEIPKQNRESLYDTADVLERGPGHGIGGSAFRTTKAEATRKSRRQRRRRSNASAEVQAKTSGESKKLTMSPLMLPKAAVPAAIPPMKKKRKRVDASKATGQHTEKTSASAGPQRKKRKGTSSKVSAKTGKKGLKRKTKASAQGAAD